MLVDRFVRTTALRKMMRTAITTIAVLFAFVNLATAQTQSVVTSRVDGPQHSSAAHAKSEHGKFFPEAEALISDEFRTVSYVQPLTRALNFEMHYFGVKRSEAIHDAHGEETERDRYLDVGAISASWDLRLGEHVTVTPGFGVYAGNRQRTSPAFTLRWEVEKAWLFSQGLLVAALRESEGLGRVSIWDGNHVSVRWRRLELGPSWERIHTRDENDWKGGARAAFRLAPHLSAVVFVLAPNHEFRAGLVVHPHR